MIVYGLIDNHAGDEVFFRNRKEAEAYLRREGVRYLYLAGENARRPWRGSYFRYKLRTDLPLKDLLVECLCRDAYYEQIEEVDVEVHRITKEERLYWDDYYEE